MQRLLLLGLLLTTPGCLFQRTYAAEPIEAQAVARLVPGQTTAGEVASQLGAPTEVVQLGRRSAYRYEHRVEKLTGMTLIVVTFTNRDAQFDRTWVFFDENDLVTHVASTFEAELAEYGMPWSSHD